MSIFLSILFAMAAIAALVLRLPTELKEHKKKFVTGMFSVSLVSLVSGGGNSGVGSDGDITAFMQLMTAKAAKDLNVDVSIKKD